MQECLFCPIEDETKPTLAANPSLGQLGPAVPPTYGSYNIT